MPTPVLPNKQATITAYTNLHNKATTSKKVHAGRNLLINGNRVNGNPVSYAKLRKETVRLWREFNHGLIIRYLDSNQYLYDVNKNQGVRAMVEVAFDQHNIPYGERIVWRCIIKNESGWRPTVWFGHAEGWQPKYVGTDTVNGLVQMRPYHADGVPNNQTVSWATYVKTSDPVYSIQKAFRLGFGPFFAQAGRCF